MPRQRTALSMINPTRLLSSRFSYSTNGAMTTRAMISGQHLMWKNVMRGGLKGITRVDNGRLRRTTTRPVKALDRNIKLNQALWFLTEKMAELKQVETGLSVVAAYSNFLISLNVSRLLRGAVFLLYAVKIRVTIKHDQKLST